MPSAFDRFAMAVSDRAGHFAVFLSAILVVLLWAVTGPLFHFSDTWQLVINTGTTIVTFLMVFLVQHTQTKDTKAIQAKLDEVIRAMPQADNRLIAKEKK